jgi:hypothetical protein
VENGKETSYSWERLFKLWAMVSTLVVAGKRSLRQVIDVLQKIVDEAEVKPPLVTCLSTVVVDYGQTLDEMIAAGHYDWMIDEITSENFPVVGKGKHNFGPQLAHFNRVISSYDVEQELDKLGLRAATHEELLAFGASFPDAQRQFPIVALGSVALIGTRQGVVRLVGDKAKRVLGLGCRDCDWLPNYRFLAVRK